MRIPLIGGAYAARSVIGNAQKSINLFPEINRKDGPQTLTHYQRPGLRVLVQGPNGAVRGLYRPSTGLGGYCVIARNVYYIDEAWELHLLGQLVQELASLVSMTDNGSTLLLVDNSPYGYAINIQGAGGSSLQEISSGAYDPATGIITLTLPAFPTWLAVGALVSLTDLEGTGAFASLNGTWPVLSVAGGTVELQGPSGEGAATITGGDFSYGVAFNAFAQIVDVTGTFQGATKVDTIDTFLLWNLPGTQQFGSTYSNELQFDPLYTAGKVDYPDLLQTLIVNRHELLLFGQLKTEIWYDAGNANFPFAELPGAYIEWGALAPYSVASEDISVFWLGQGLSGVGLVFRQIGYQTKPISNHAISYAIREMAAAGADLSDAIAYCYTQDGHIFYVLTFVSGDQTWVYDDSVNDPMAAWHQRGWTDQNGTLHRERANCHAFINGQNVVGDWQNGTLYALDPDHYTDDVDGVAGPIMCTRTLPLVMAGMAVGGQPELADGRLIQVHKFVADIEVGGAPPNLTGLPPQITLRWSFDRGKTWGQGVFQSDGTTGQYSIEPRWSPLGIGRFPLLEVSYSIPGQVAFNGGWIDATVAQK